MQQPELSTIARTIERKAKNDASLKREIKTLTGSITHTERMALLDANARLSTNPNVRRDASQWVYRILSGWSDASIGERFVALKTVKTMAGDTDQTGN